MASPRFFLPPPLPPSTKRTVSEFLNSAIEAAHAAGGLLRSHFGRSLHVDANEAHDIKLELDRRSQTLIESLILEKFPSHAIYGEEGVRGDSSSEYQWVIDPIDGTVNFFYNIPHFAISIALRHGGSILAGVIYDPMRDELWAAEKGGAATLNGSPIAVSKRRIMSDAMISVGFSKSIGTINSGIPLFERMVRSAKKCRMMGSAALDVAYVASGRLDAYIESQVNLWDVAAGVLLVEMAGGIVELKPHESAHDKFSIVASSGNLDLGL